MSTPVHGERDFGVYVHVPFCSVRCGYCDFNTYTPSETDGATPDDYVAAALQEITLAREAMKGDPRPVSTVFFGGGTPTLLAPEAIVAIIHAIDAAWGLAAEAEITVEANPDSVTADSLRALAHAGVTRMSFGMQSAVSSTLATLDRTHDPRAVALAVAWAREARMAVSVDLIYGTPGETLADWAQSIDAAIALDVDHVSAYALVIEPGTRMGAALRRGLIEPTDGDRQADMYEYADAALSAAGYEWYEVSNWARTPADRCRHNVGYWLSHDWWGIGPGAHSYLGPRVGPDGASRDAQRWWNVKHPRAYAERIAAGDDLRAGVETLTPDDCALETVMLRLRLADGIDRSLVAPDRSAAIARLIADGILDGSSALAGTLRLTRRGRLLADAAVRALV